jgi:flagellum-specific peptidoglycan hydrolase FlgJ
MSEQCVEYEFYFTDSDYADKVTKLYNELELQNKYISIKNKSLLTHKDVETELWDLI